VKRIILSGAALIALAFTLVSTAPTTLAQTSGGQITAARCSVAAAKLDARITRVAAAKETQVKLYEGLKGKVDSLLERATAKGYDTTALTAASQAVKAKIEVYVEKATAYDTALKAAKELTCGESDGAFAQALSDARSALLATRSAAIDVRTTFRTDALPALQAYAEWLREQNTTGETN
jgi:hypothetical protein